jgi:hypothetical protein
MCPDCLQILQHIIPRTYFSLEPCFLLPHVFTPVVAAQSIQTLNRHPFLQLATTHFYLTVCCFSQISSSLEERNSRNTGESECLRGMILPYRYARTIGKRELAVGNCNGRDFSVEKIVKIGVQVSCLRAYRKKFLCTNE